MHQRLTLQCMEVFESLGLFSGMCSSGVDLFCVPIAAHSMAKGCNSLSACNLAPCGGPGDYVTYSFAVGQTVYL